MVRKIVFISLILIVCVLSTRYYEKKGITERELFYDAKVDDTIDGISLSGGSVHTYINKKRYSIKGEYLKVKGDLSFSNMAEKGDKIYKDSYSDTFLLIKHNDTIRYVF